MPRHRHDWLSFASNVFWLLILFGRCVNANSMEEFFNDDSETTTSTSALSSNLHQHCGSFLDCESEMMNIHQKCTSASRQATGEACGLVKDFRELNTLMETRVNEFAICVSNETNILLQDQFLVETLELPFNECDNADSSVMHNIMERQGCWKALGQVKRRCQTLQKCCPAAKTCTKKGRATSATFNVRQKHIEINRRTLECRNSMREVLEKRNRGENVSPFMIARAHAVLTTENSNPIDTIQKKYVYNKAERQQQKSTNELVPLKQGQGPTTKAPLRRGLPSRAEIIRRISQKANQNRNRKVLKTGDIYVPPLTPKRMNLVAGEVIFETKSTAAPLVPYHVPPKPARMRTHLKKVKLSSPITTQSPTTTTPLPTTTSTLPTTTTTTMASTTTTTAPSTTTTSFSHLEKTRLEQFREFEKMLGEVYAPTGTPPFEAPTTSTAAPTAKTTRKPSLNGIRNFPMPPPTGIFPSEPKSLQSNQKLAQIQTMFQPQAFALPPTVNLTKMKVFDARPKLQPMHGDPTEGRMMPPRRRIRPTKRTTITTTVATTTTASTTTASTTTTAAPTTTTASTMTPTTTTAQITKRQRAHAIKTAVDQVPLKRIDISLPKDTGKVAGDAYVNTDGAWTVDPAPLDYADYGRQEDAKHITIVKDELVPNAQKFDTKSIHKNLDKHSLVILDKPSTHTFESDIQSFDTIDLTTVSPNTPSERTTIPEAVNRRKTGPQEMKLTRKDEAEMMLVKKDLVKNLEMFVVKHTHDAALEKENERLRMLRRGRQDPAAADMSYCKMYAVCSEQLKFVQKECEDSSGRLVPGLPKRRFGDCNKRLVAQYKRVDKMRKRLEKGFDICLTDRIAANNASSIATCPIDWPVLPLFEEQFICDQRKRVIQNHCTKLARCCGAAQECRAALDGSTLSQKLVNKQERLAEASAKCQIRAYNDYKKYQSSSSAVTKPVKRRQLHAVKTVTVAKTAAFPSHSTVKPLPTLVTPARRRYQHQTPAPGAPFLQPLIFGELNRQRISIPMNGDDLSLYTRKQRRRNL